jgi:hypothetical protein
MNRYWRLFDPCRMNHTGGRTGGQRHLSGGVPFPSDAVGGATNPEDQVPGHASTETSRKTLSGVGSERGSPQKDGQPALESGVSPQQQALIDEVVQNAALLTSSQGASVLDFPEVSRRRFSSPLRGEPAGLESAPPQSKYSSPIIQSKDPLESPSKRPNSTSFSTKGKPTNAPQLLEQPKTLPHHAVLARKSQEATEEAQRKRRRDREHEAELPLKAGAYHGKRREVLEEGRSPREAPASALPSSGTMFEKGQCDPAADLSPLSAARGEARHFRAQAVGGPSSPGLQSPPEGAPLGRTPRDALGRALRRLEEVGGGELQGLERLCQNEVNGGARGSLEGSGAGAFGGVRGPVNGSQGVEGEAGRLEVEGGSKVADRRGDARDCWVPGGSELPPGQERQSEGQGLGGTAPVQERLPAFQVALKEEERTESEEDEGSWKRKKAAGREREQRDVSVEDVKAEERSLARFLEEETVGNGRTSPEAKEQGVAHGPWREWHMGAKPRESKMRSLRAMLEKEEKSLGTKPKKGPEQKKRKEGDHRGQSSAAKRRERTPEAKAEHGYVKTEAEQGNVRLKAETSGARDVLEGAEKREEERIVSEDVSRGIERHKIPCVNAYTDRGLPKKFRYMRESRPYSVSARATLLGLFCPVLMQLLRIVALTISATLL